MSNNASSAVSCPPLSSSNSSPSCPFMFCLKQKANFDIICGYVAISALFLLPIFIFVLHIGQQRWSKQRSVGAPTMMSHSDFFTYNMVVIEIISFIGIWLTFYGLYSRVKILFLIGICLFFITAPEQVMVHGLTCMERLLAVVYPVTYMRLRKASGVKIRNMCIVFVWMFCFIGMYVMEETVRDSRSIFGLFFWGVSIAIITVSSLSAVNVLIRPRPGGGGRDKSEPSLKRAFNTIIIILVILIARGSAYIVAFVVLPDSKLKLDVRCGVLASLIYLSLPSSLVLPLLFLQRAGKLPGCKKHPESG